MSDDTTIGHHYDQVAFTSGPGIYSSQPLYDDMYALGEFVRPGPVEVLDAMCGAGLVGKEMSKRLTAAEISHTVHYVDLAAKKIEALRQEGNDAQVASVLELPYEPQSFDRVYARFGVKNYPRDDQLRIFRKFKDVLKVSGIFVLTDMEAPPKAYEFMQYERREKHKYTGLEGNEPHIPTFDDWKTMIREGGFVPRATRRHISYVVTADWVKSNQMTPQDLEKMNAFLLAAPETARKSLNIRQEDGLIKIDYPVVIISATAA
ncbi:MAG TPA: class I SAM-dependent methyltransferase [archaeon]|nr:class I SAM-dependent methyltransferase [archaeon]